MTFLVTRFQVLVDWIKILSSKNTLFIVSDIARNESCKAQKFPDQETKLH